MMADDKQIYQVVIIYLKMITSHVMNKQTEFALFPELALQNWKVNSDEKKRSEIKLIINCYNKISGGEFLNFKGACKRVMFIYNYERGKKKVSPLFFFLSLDDHFMPLSC